MKELTLKKHNDTYARMQKAFNTKLYIASTTRTENGHMFVSVHKIQCTMPTLTCEQIMNAEKLQGKLYNSFNSVMVAPQGFEAVTITASEPR
jgi:hypothetical protein